MEVKSSSITELSVSCHLFISWYQITSKSVNNISIRSFNSEVIQNVNVLISQQMPIV